MQNPYARYSCCRCDRGATAVVCQPGESDAWKKSYLCNTHFYAYDKATNDWYDRIQAKQWGQQQWYKDLMAGPQTALL